MFTVMNQRNERLADRGRIYRTRWVARISRFFWIRVQKNLDISLPGLDDRHVAEAIVSRVRRSSSRGSDRLTRLTIVISRKRLLFGVAGEEAIVERPSAV